MKVSAHQCQYCGELFLSEPEWEECETKCGEIASERAAQEVQNAELNYWKDYPRLNASTLDELVEMCLIASSKLNDGHGLKRMSFNTIQFSAREQLGYFEKPFDQELQPNVRYTILYGSLTYDFDDSHQSHNYHTDPFLSEIDDYCNGIHGIRLGTGGPSRQTFKIVLDDFPKLKETVLAIVAKANAMNQIEDNFWSRVAELEARDGRLIELAEEESHLESKLEEIRDRLQETRDSISRIKTEIREPFKEKLKSMEYAIRNPYGIVAKYRNSW